VFSTYEEQHEQMKLQVVWNVVTLRPVNSYRQSKGKLCLLFQGK